MEGKHVLLGVTGSVAAINSGVVAASLLDRGIEVKIVPTKTAMLFSTEYCGAEVCKDEDEFGQWHNRGDPVLHIEVSSYLAAEMGRFAAYCPSLSQYARKDRKRALRQSPYMRCSSVGPSQAYAISPCYEHCDVGKPLHS